MRPTAAGQPKVNRKSFVLLIPAHNEEMVLAPMLDSIERLDYPSSARTVVVIADNCSDCTADIARARGALVLERFDTTLIGKGYALEWALKELERRGLNTFEAVVILDADTKPSANLLSEFEACLARGEQAMQARYEVLNADETWRTRLMSCALALVHVARPLGRERLHLSDGLKGNGMCFAAAVVQAVPWSGESITEDIEYTLRLCRAGFRVAFVPEAAVWAQMPTTSGQASSQRERWESGRYRLMTSVAPRLYMDGVRTRNRMLRDRALDLIVPPFAEMFAVPLLMMCAAAAAALFGWRVAPALAAAWGCLLVLQAGYLFAGMWIARVPRRIAMAILCAPPYIVWKFALYARMAAGRTTGGWKRTERRKL